MNRIFLSAAMVFIGLSTQAQNLTDVFRYSQEGINGTARFSAMGGAFGALGGDLSALAVNPAGSAVFLENSTTLTFAVEGNRNTTDYFNSINTENLTQFTLNQAGAVFVFDIMEENAAVQKVTLGFNFQSVRNFENDFLVGGQANNSIDQYFLGYANGVSLDLLQTVPGESVSDLYAYLGSNYGFGHQQALLGYQSYILEPNDSDNPNNTGYHSNIAPGTFGHNYYYSGSGFHAKSSINLGMQIQQDWYTGINFNIHTGEYFESRHLRETNSNTGSVVREVNFHNNLSSITTGFSMQLGLIRKLNNTRVGLAYDTPTWFRTSEETSQYIRTGRLVGGSLQSLTVDPNIINIYEDYRFRTPGKWTASLAHLFGPQGLISLDYSIRDHSNMQFRDSHPHFDMENQRIDQLLKTASTVRLGGEYRHKMMRFRGGFRYEESPFDNKNLMSDLIGFSGGIGIDFGFTRLDLSYIYTQQERNHELLGGAFGNTANLDTVNHTVALTLGFGL